LKTEEGAETLLYEKQNIFGGTLLLEDGVLCISVAIAVSKVGEGLCALLGFKTQDLHKPLTLYIDTIS
jgi:hypothetical protein